MDVVVVNRRWMGRELAVVAVVLKILMVLEFEEVLLILLTLKVVVCQRKPIW